jgi:hypothetical protein
MTGHSTLSGFTASRVAWRHLHDWQRVSKRDAVAG